MSELVRDRVEPEDLSALLRRGQASRAEEAALRRAISRDGAVRVGHQLGLDFDQDTCVRAGDEQLIVRAADAALARVAPAVRVRSWQMAAALAVAALSCTGIGAALWVAGVSPFQRTESSRPQSQPTRALPTQSVPLPQPPAAESAAVVPSEQPTHEPRRAPRPAAAELFHSANTARRDGELGRARRLYAELIRHEPSSDEAHVAHVSLGKLLLTQGQFADAEREFRRYLSAGGGPLSEEALFHRAESLAKLGRAAEERQAWQALLSAFPDSLYVARAKERLSASRESSAP
jgi:TolA-binding protein